ncbi:formin-like protein 14 [Pyrus ussuriensis x Pyrus communis]|uniref:Formin-like protein 14 n=1 Tax=Pyrus ussuriensis x Pyrus communis TaxID=2448454 RepID=A0A5N5FZQ6_9ROSA|nr:formin-like protein 14 [Pyrus ussuriensis x Pyrus communis]
MYNDIYKFIMFSKVTVITKPKLLTTTLFFWNIRTNTFNFRMGLISPTILDTAQVFRLRPSNRLGVRCLCVEKVSLILRSNFPRRFRGKCQQLVTSYCLHSPPDMTFQTAQRSLEVMSRIAHKHVALNFESQGNTEEVDVRPEEEVANALALQEAITEVTRQEVRSSQATGDTGDIFELFDDLEDEAGPEVETQAPRRARETMVESSKFEPEERPQPRPPVTKKLASTPKEGDSEGEVQPKDKAILNTILEELKAKVGESASSVGQSSAPTPSTLPPAMVVIPTSQFNLRTREMLHYVEDDSTSAFGEGSGKSPQLVAHKVVIPRLPKASGVTGILIPRLKKIIVDVSFTSGTFPLLSTEAASSAIASG